MAVDPVFHDDYGSPHYSVSVSPFRKSNWKSPGARDYWEEYIADFRRDISSDALVSIVADEDIMKDVAFIRMSSNKQMKFVADANSEGVFFTQLDTTASSTHPFVHYPNVTDCGGRDKSNIIIGKDTDDISRVAEFITDSDHEDEDEYYWVCDQLGIPDCCAEHHFEEYKKGNPDPVYQAACNTPSAEVHEQDPNEVIVNTPDPLLNVFWRYMGWQFIYHVPCSFECEQSGQQAREHFRIFEQLGYGDEAAMVLDWLDLPMTYTGRHTASNLRNAYGIGSYNTNPYALEKEIIWKQPHQQKPEFEPNHPTTELEPLDPGRGAI